MTTRKRGTRQRRVTQADIDRTRRELDFADSPENTRHSTILAAWDRAYPSKGGK